MLSRAALLLAVLVLCPGWIEALAVTVQHSLDGSSFIDAGVVDLVSSATCRSSRSVCFPAFRAFVQFE